MQASGRNQEADMRNRRADRHDGIGCGLAMLGITRAPGPRGPPPPHG